MISTNVPSEKEVGRLIRSILSLCQEHSTPVAFGFSRRELGSLVHGKKHMSTCVVGLLSQVEDPSVDTPWRFVWREAWRLQRDFALEFAIITTLAEQTRNPLWIAIEQGYPLELIETCLEQGWSLTQIDPKDGTSGWIKAVRYRHAPICNVLFPGEPSASSASLVSTVAMDMKSRTFRGETVIHLAALYASGDLLKRILLRCLPFLQEILNVLDFNGNTALMLACQRKYGIELARALLEFHADVHVENRYSGMRAMDYACRYGNTLQAKELHMREPGLFQQELGGWTGKAVVSKRWTIFGYACQSGNLSLVKWILMKCEERLHGNELLNYLTRLDVDKRDALWHARECKQQDLIGFLQTKMDWQFAQ